MLADALVGLGDWHLMPGGVAAGSELFDPLVPALVAMAEHDVASTPADAARTEQVEHTVVGTVVFEVAYAAVLRLALEDASARRFGQKVRSGRSGRGRSTAEVDSVGPDAANQ